MEQLAPILNPREGPPEWYRESATAGGGFSSKRANGSIGIAAVGGDVLMLRLLLELNGVPEVSGLPCRHRVAFDTVLTCDAALHPLGHCPVRFSHDSMY